jgi:phage baseplate assembly protein V
MNLNGLRMRVVNMVARAVVKLVDDTLDAQSIQIQVMGGEDFAPEIRSDVQRFQNYGFSSVPHPGAEVAVVFVGGRRDHGLAIAVDDRRYRVRDLESGEVCVYDDLGSVIVLKRSGDVEITPASGVVRVNGEVHADDVKAGAISLKHHTHPYTDTPVGAATTLEPT